nr:MAG TPA: hypothetical protein [Caudoviricetes sp.]
MLAVTLNSQGTFKTWAVYAACCSCLVRPY